MVPQLTAEQRKLVQAAAGMARRLAQRAVARWPEVSFDELASIANEAIVHAARVFDPSRGVPFEAYAYARVQGDLRRVTARELLGRLPKLRAIHHVDQQESLRTVKKAELAEAMNDSPTAARRRLADWTRREVASMVAAALLAEQRTQRADERYEHQQAYQRAHQALERAVASLPALQRQFVQSYYRDGATLAEISKQHGRSPRTIQRLHDQIKATLAHKLTQAGVTQAPPIVDAAPS